MIPAAGLGTRTLPASKSIPKVMLPVYDTPALHYAVDEAAQAGIEHIIIVVSQDQTSISAYFERSPDLEAVLEKRGDINLLERMRAISEMTEISYVPQHRPLGLGHAVLTARTLIGHEPFAVLLPDDIILDDIPTISRMIPVFTEYGNSVLAVKEVTAETIPNVGIAVTRPVTEAIHELVGIVEKPSLAEAPSNLAVTGRYVLTPEVFVMLEQTKPGAVDEIQLTDAIAKLLSKQSVYGYQFPGLHIDVGTPLGLLKASVYAVLQDGPDADVFRRWIVSLGCELRIS